MWNIPTETQLKKLPVMADSKGTADKIVYLHFFMGGCDWWATEYNPVDNCFFGFVNLNDKDNSEWGYFSLAELKDINIKGIEIDTDKYWKPTAVKDIPEIVKCGGSWE